MNKLNYSLMAAALLTGTIVLSSCSSDELPVDNEVQQLATEAAKTYSFSVSALIGEGDEADTRYFEIGDSTIVSRFSENEEVWMIIKQSTRDGYIIAYSDSPLYPTNVSEDGKSCTLAADNLTFNSASTTGFTPQVGDEVYLYYNLFHEPSSSLYAYIFGVVDKDTVEMLDYCLAKMKITGVGSNGTLTFGQIDDETKTNFIFKNINSVFRQKLTFVDKNGNPVTPDIERVEISSTGNQTVQFYFPFSEQGVNLYGYEKFEFSPGSVFDGNIYFTTMFNDENKNDSIVFTVYDKKGMTYSLTKPAPEGGFQNNKYYYGDAVLKWVSGPVEPTITGMVDYSKSLNNYGGYNYEIKDNPINISISGESVDYSFRLNYPGTVTLENLTAEVNVYQPFLDVYSFEQDLILNLSGDNYIKMNKEDRRAFEGFKTTLQLKCEDEVATLKIWVIDGKDDHGGFYDFKNIDFSNLGTTDALDAEALKSIAAEGYTVERSAKTVDGDGAYWIFTVRKKS